MAFWSPRTQTRETHKETWQAVPAEAPRQNSEASREQMVMANRYVDRHELADLSHLRPLVVAPSGWPLAGSGSRPGVSADILTIQELLSRRNGETAILFTNVLNRD